MEVETEIYGNYRDMLLSVKPGLTGFRAANGRSSVPHMHAEEQWRFAISKTALSALT